MSAIVESRVLVLGGGGFVGNRIVQSLLKRGDLAVRVASRRPRSAASAVETVRADTLNASELRAAMANCQAVVNCVTGSAETIVQGARVLAEAVRATGCPRVVHMSSMAAYGELDGAIDERTPLGAGGGWYAEAKRETEGILGALATQGTRVVMLRPGCVHGPGSHLWVSRMGDWLRAGRLGDLGLAGDGWSNLVHVDDVAQATVAALDVLPGPGSALVVNLSAPDSPRWNEYLVALGCAIGATPVSSITSRQLKLDAYLAGPPLRVWERLAPRLHVPSRWAPPAIAPSLLHLLQQDRHLQSTVAVPVLGVQWTPFEQSVADSARWYLQRSADAAGRSS